MRLTRREAGMRATRPERGRIPERQGRDPGTPARDPRPRTRNAPGTRPGVRGRTCWDAAGRAGIRGPTSWWVPTSCWAGPS